MNKYAMSGKLMHKASDHNTKRCEVVKWVFLPHSDFERLKANPYQEHEANSGATALLRKSRSVDLPPSVSPKRNTAFFTFVRDDTVEH